MVSPRTRWWRTVRLQPSRTTNPAMNSILGDTVCVCASPGKAQHLAQLMLRGLHFEQAAAAAHFFCVHMHIQHVCKHITWTGLKSCSAGAGACKPYKASTGVHHSRSTLLGTRPS